ncbi:MAG: hypothetical protein CM1200mP10_10400 [Candidatus Neomarinimicrobiota bacterium]|nr:MAG: hypothetical protein CM1200mP10_10400 [Candidatus Neomarinimicrobiota bacterium]
MEQYGIQYIFNDDWERLITLYHWPWLLLFETDFILLEGDLIFMWEAFKNMLGPNKIAVDRFQPYMDGTVGLH